MLTFENGGSLGSKHDLLPTMDFSYRPAALDLGADLITMSHHTLTARLAKVLLVRNERLIEPLYRFE
jgi:hypothetical protein